MIDPSSHRFNISLPPEPVTLEVDPDRIAQVIANMVHNAFKYTPVGGQIDLVVEFQDHEVAIRVRDNGVGIASGVLPHVFDMYTQGGGSAVTGLKGLGVGLALVRQLVELHGGSVAAYSEGLQKGTEFVVRLPSAGEARPTQDHSSAQETAAGSPEDSKVLIVDDHRDAAHAMAALLESSGHIVEACFEGTAALKKAETYRPDVIILDIGLPGMDGYEVARRMRELLPEAMLIALTGWVADDNAARAREAGFDHYMVKPVQFPEVQRLLASRSRK
jgi:CheY-like chemotaxis protein